MIVVAVSPKYQIVIPREICESMGIVPGQKSPGHVISGANQRIVRENDEKAEAPPKDIIRNKKCAFFGSSGAC